MMTAIEKIIITERIRKEITNIPELAEDIKMNGLLQPIIVMEVDGGVFKLLAGLRRIKAVELIGWKEIEVKVVAPSDAEAALRIEISENEQREDFTFSEKMDFARLLAEIEGAKAKERMLSGKKSCENDPVSERTQGLTGKTRDIVAAKIGMSGTQYQRAKTVADNATSEMIEQLDSGERSIYGTYEELRKKKKAEEQSEDDTSTGTVDLPETDNSQETDAADELTPVTEPTNEPAQETKTTPKPKNKGELAIPRRSRSVSEEDEMRLLSEKDREAIRKNKEFDALPPEGKIAELQRQLKEMRVRAVSAEGDLSTLKLNSGITIDNKDSIIEGLKRQNSDLNKILEEAEVRITEANVRIAELEARIADLEAGK